MFVDGTLLSSSVADNKNNLTETIQTNVSLTVGSLSGTTPSAFGGQIDDVRIYNRRLSREDVQQLYASGLRALAGVPAEIRTPEQQAFLVAAYRPQDEPLVRIQNQLAASKTALRDARWDGVRRWYVNSQGQTMVVIPNPAENGNSRIDHSFAISSHEVTVAEFRRFRSQHSVQRDIAPTDNCPVHYVTWYMAAEYCNWLSEQEGIAEDEWVYQRNAGGQYADGMTIRANALDLTGYRLPTDMEWEYACRSGTSGWYGFGEPVPLLDRYARYVVNSSGRSHSVESLLPNANGLFDMHGNLWEWTQNPVSGSMSPVRNGTRRLLRGGSFYSLSSSVRSADRSYFRRPSVRNSVVGFRPSRTYLLSP